MSLRYRNNNGEESHIAGMNGTSGELVPSVSLYQSGTIEIPGQTSHSSQTLSVTFATPMPDANYQVTFKNRYGPGDILNVEWQGTTGFSVFVYNASEDSTGSHGLNWSAFKLMTDEATAIATEQIAQNTRNFAPTFSESVAYSVGNYVTHLGLVFRCTTAHSAGAWDLSHFTAVTVGGTLGEIVPANASSSNKLATAADNNFTYKVLTPDTDLNNIKTSGTYSIYISDTASQATNHAPGYGWLQLIVIQMNNSPAYCNQILYSGAGGIFKRECSADVWTSWKQLVSDEIITGVPTSVYSGIDNVVLKKQGKMVTLTVNYDATNMPASNWTTIMNIPVGFRPAYGTSISVGNAFGYSSVANLYATGELSVYKHNAEVGLYNYINATWTTE